MKSNHINDRLSQESVILCLLKVTIIRFTTSVRSQSLFLSVHLCLKFEIFFSNLNVIKWKSVICNKQNTTLLGSAWDVICIYDFPVIKVYYKKNEIYKANVAKYNNIPYLTFHGIQIKILFALTSKEFNT